MSQTECLPSNRTRFHGLMFFIFEFWIVLAFVYKKDLIHFLRLSIRRDLLVDLWNPTCTFVEDAYRCKKTPTIIALSMARWSSGMILA